MTQSFNTAAWPFPKSGRDKFFQAQLTYTHAYHEVMSSERPRIFTYSTLHLYYTVDKVQNLVRLRAQLHVL